MENALNQSVLQPMKSPVASAEAVTSVEVNVIVMRRLTLPPPVRTQKCVFTLILPLVCGFSYNWL